MIITNTTLILLLLACHNQLTKKIIYLDSYA